MYQLEECFFFSLITESHSVENILCDFYVHSIIDYLHLSYLVKLSTWPRYLQLKKTYKIAFHVPVTFCL